jgi:dolichyl-phosphate beta-glucosyltransferase
MTGRNLSDSPIQDCAVVVPCFNEAARLQVDVYARFLAEAPPQISLFFVDDGSTDATLQVLERLRSAAPRIVILPKFPNSGKGEAVRYGMQYALENTPAAVVGFWDADLATPLRAISDLARVLDEFPAIDMVFGSRVKLLGRQIERKVHRHYLGRVFATVVSNVLDLPVYDTQCGAKLFRRTPRLSAVLQTPFLSRWIFDVEILARFISAFGIEYVANSVYEYPLTEWRDVGGSKVKPVDFLKAATELARIWNANLRGARRTKTHAAGGR